MNRSTNRNKQQQKPSSRSKSRQHIDKSKGQSQTRNKEDKLHINPKKGVNIGKRTGQQVKKKETGLNYDGTEKLSDYFAKQDGLLIDSDQNINPNKTNGGNQKAQVDNLVSSISDLQDDSEILNLLNKKDSLEFNLSSEQSLIDQNDRNSIENKYNQQNNSRNGKAQYDQNYYQNTENNYQTHHKRDRKSDERRESSLGLKQFKSNVLEIPSTRSRKTSSFRLQRSQNSKNRNSIALSSIPRVSRFSARLLDNQSDISSDRQDDFELLGQLSNLPPELLAQNLQQGTSLNDTPFTKNLEDFEITLSESEISQINQQDFSYLKHQKRRTFPNQNNRVQDEQEDEEMEDLIAKNKQLILKMSQRKKQNSSNSFNNNNSCLLDISESRIYKSARINTNIHDFGKFSPIQEINTQQSDKKQVELKENKNRTEITIEPSEIQLENSEMILQNKNIMENENIQFQQSNQTNQKRKSDDIKIILTQIDDKKPEEKSPKVNEKLPKKLKPNPMLQDQENINPNENQNFKYTKVQRPSKEKKSYNNEMRSEDDQQIEVKIVEKATAPKQMKQLKKNRQSLDTSDISTKNVKYEIDNQNNADIDLNQKNEIVQNDINKDKLEIQEKEAVLHQKQQLIKDYIKQKRNSTDIYLQSTIESADKIKDRISNQNQIASYENNKKMIDEQSYQPTLQLDSNYKRDDQENDNYYQMDQMEVIEYQSDQGNDIYHLERKSLSNKKMDVECEGQVESSDQKNILNQSVDYPKKRGRPKRKRITPEKNRNNSQSEQSISASETDSSQSDSSITSKPKKEKKSKGSSFNSQSSSISSQISKKPRKKVIKYAPKEIFSWNQELYEKGFTKDQVEVQIKNEAKSFGKDGRYPVRNRIRALVSWKETAVYGSQGLLYVITSKDSQDPFYKNYTIPGFSNIPTPRFSKKILKRNTSNNRQLDEIKEEEADETDLFKQIESFKNEGRQSVETDKVSNKQASLNQKQNEDKLKNQNKKQNNTNLSELEEEEIPTKKQPLPRKKSIDQKQIENKHIKSKSPLPAHQSQKDKIIKNPQNENQKKESANFQTNNLKNEDLNSRNLSKDQKQRQQNNTKFKQNYSKEDLDLIKQLFNDQDLSKFNMKINESSSDVLKITLTLNPGAEIISSISKYRIEIKVIECSWKKLLICIDDSTSYLKQDDKKIIKKGQEFSIKYKERENSKSSIINISFLKNYISSKSSKV